MAEKRKRPGAEPGSNKHLKTPEKARQVEALSGLGLKPEEIGYVIGCDSLTISRHYHDEIKTGRPKADAAVLQSLFKIATGNTPQAASCAMFYLKVRRRWHEVQRIMHGFDPELLKVFVKQVTDVLRKYLPDMCPHCKTRLDMKPQIAGELRKLSVQMMERLPPSQIVPLEPEVVLGDDLPTTQAKA